MTFHEWSTDDQPEPVDDASTTRARRSRHDDNDVLPLRGTTGDKGTIAAPGALQVVEHEDAEHSTDVTDIDAWRTVAPNGYSRAKYYMRATDGKGHSQNMQVKVTEQIGGMIGALVASGMTRYKTPQDFVRDAIVHRLHDMHEMGRAGLIEGQLPEVIALAQIEQAGVERDARHALCERTGAEIETLVQRGQTDEIVIHLDALEVISSGWPDYDKARAQMVIARGNEALRRPGKGNGK